MGSITYKKMDLFSAPKDSILVHSCNAKGVWGSGIAVEFKKRFPGVFLEYNKYCRQLGDVGIAVLVPDKNHYVGNLIASSGYADTLDTKDEILVNTTLALNNLCYNIEQKGLEERTVYSNKFNSGLFKVPWNETEKILKVFVDRYNLKWVVCEQ